MSHPEQRAFCEKIKQQAPYAFSSRRVLDIGSCDINGNNRYLFDNCTYLGIDVAPGANVDQVTPGHLLDMPRESFDTIISTEALEHDPYWRQTLQHTTWLLKSGGFYLFTCATTGRKTHGTVDILPEQNNATIAKIPEFENHYQNLRIEDVLSALDFPRLFYRYAFEVDTLCCDLYFWGIKR